MGMFICEWGYSHCKLQKRCSLTNDYTTTLVRSHCASLALSEARPTSSETSQLQLTYLPRKASAAFVVASQTQKPPASSGVSLGLICQNELRTDGRTYLSR